MFKGRYAEKKYIIHILDKKSGVKCMFSEAL
jgi:hypothetical protein